VGELPHIDSRPILAPPDNNSKLARN
jgi:hypothetical protein